MKCPTCGSKSTEALRGFQPEARKYKCVDCGTVFKPAVPKWNGWVYLVFGSIFLLAGVCAVTEYNPGGGVSPEQRVVYLGVPWAIGLGLTTYGILLLRGRAGNLEVETPRPPSSAQSERTSGKKPLPTTRKRLQKATTGDIILSVILPGWGILIGLMALCVGEKQRARTMMGIGACILVLDIFVAILLTCFGDIYG